MMAIRDLLLPLIGDATRSTAAAIEKCVAMAAELDAHITALALETEDDALPPTVADVLGAREVVQTNRPRAHCALHSTRQGQGSALVAITASSPRRLPE